MLRTFLTVVGAVAVCVLALAGDEPVPTAPYTLAQAQVGRVAYESSCGKCHTNELSGRTGAPGEMPPVSSLPPKMRIVVEAAEGKIPPLAGKSFLERWQDKTTKQLSHRIEEAVGGFPPDGADAETYLKVTAYILQANGAKPGPETFSPATAVEIRSITRPAPAPSSR